jgi:hypothetical protein
LSLIPQPKKKKRKLYVQSDDYPLKFTIKIPRLIPLKPKKKLSNPPLSISDLPNFRKSFPKFVFAKASPSEENKLLISHFKQQPQKKKKQVNFVFVHQKLSDTFFLTHHCSLLCDLTFVF